MVKNIGSFVTVKGFQQPFSLVSFFVSFFSVKIRKKQSFIKPELKLAAQVEVEGTTGPVLLDNLNSILSNTVGDDKLHYAISFVLAQVERRLYNHLGKWLIFGEYRY